MNNNNGVLFFRFELLAAVVFCVGWSRKRHGKTHERLVALLSGEQGERNATSPVGVNNSVQARWLRRGSTTRSAA